MEEGVEEVEGVGQQGVGRPSRWPGEEEGAAVGQRAARMAVGQEEGGPGWDGCD